MSKKEFVFKFEESCPERLDLILKKEFKEHSRSYLVKMIEQKNVQIDKKICTKPGQKIKPGQSVKVKFTPLESLNLEPIFVDFKVVLDHPDFAVINKPAGLLVHPAGSAPNQVTLVHGLLHKFEQIKENFKNCLDLELRPGIVHRLDKETSGLILVAKNPQALTQLSQLFAQRKVIKKYIATVHGHTNEFGTIEKPIGRHPSDPQKMAVNGVGAKYAKSQFKLLKKLENNRSILEVEIFTGRTHQIRVHLASLGHPIVGDKIYGKKADAKEVKNHLLHSAYLKFKFKEQEFEIKENK